MSRYERVWIVVALLCAAIWLLLTPPFDAIGGVLVGAVISVVVSRYYYQQASGELKDEAEKLRDATEIVIRMKQTESGGGKAEAIWDERGKSKGVAHHFTVTDSAGVTDSREAQIKPRSDEGRDPEP
jgi:hypothetical protein